MSEEEDEEIRALQERLVEEAEARRKREEEIRARERQIEIIVKQLLTSEAWERLKRIEYVKPELASNVKTLLIQLYNSGKLNRRLTDEELKELLRRLSEQLRRDFRIKVV
jgi:programmed cell death protein 5